MNNFEAKYIKIASEYLDEKLSKINFYQEHQKKEKKKELSIKNIVSGIFGMSTKD